MLIVNIDMTDEMRAELFEQIENRDMTDDWLEEAEAKVGEENDSTR